MSLTCTVIVIHIVHATEIQISHAAANNLVYPVLFRATLSDLFLVLSTNIKVGNRHPIPA